MREKFVVGILGASGLETEALLDGLLAGEAFEVAEVRIFGNRGSVGRRLSFGDTRVAVEESARARMSECDVLFLTVPAASATLDELGDAGVFCVDLVSWRQEPIAPFLVPGVNGHALSAENLLARPVVSTPDPVVTLSAMAIQALAEEHGLESVSLTTCESLSGAGKPGLEVLREESQQFFQAEDLASRSSALFARSVLFNVMPCAHEAKTASDAPGELAMGLIQVLGCQALRIDVERLRVPAFVGVAVSTIVGLSGPTSIENAKARLAARFGEVFEGDDSCSLREVQGQDGVHVTVRSAASVPHGISLWLAADNLRLQVRNALGCVDLVTRNGIMAALRQMKRGTR